MKSPPPRNPAAACVQHGEMGGKRRSLFYAIMGFSDTESREAALRVTGVNRNFHFRSGSTPMYLSPLTCVKPHWTLSPDSRHGVYGLP
jgi:hypothetical protein